MTTHAGALTLHAGALTFILRRSYYQKVCIFRLFLLIASVAVTSVKIHIHPRVAAKQSSPWGNLIALRIASHCTMYDGLIIFLRKIQSMSRLSSSFFVVVLLLCFFSILTSWVVVHQFALADSLEHFDIWDRISILGSKQSKHASNWALLKDRNCTSETCEHFSLARHADCDNLTELWNKATAFHGIYMEVGTLCVMHMLLSTNASIITFESSQKDLLDLTTSLEKMDRAYQSRVNIIEKHHNRMQHDMDAINSSFFHNDTLIITLLKVGCLECSVITDKVLERTQIVMDELQNCPILRSKLAAASFQEGRHAGVFWKRENVTTTMKLTMNPKIPHRLIFTSKHDILRSREPTIFYNNVRRTIQLYQQAWGEPNAEVWFLTDETCRDIIQKANSTLLRFFDTEHYGKFKADICRVAALYLKGGYYFDVDIRVVKPVLLSEKISFATVVTEDDAQFFQAFLASEPQSPILREAFAEMICVYTHHENLRGILVGPITLKRAYDKVKTDERGEVRLFHEVNLSRSNDYPGVTRQSGNGCCCNFVVHDADKEEIYFFSRIVGASSFCSS